MITYEQFKEVETRVGTIVEAEKVLKADKLLKLTVDLGEEDVRTIVSGIAEHFSPEDIIDTQACFVTNLEPREIFGIESQGMILAIRDEDGVSLVRPDRKVPVGSTIS